MNFEKAVNHSGYGEDTPREIWPKGVQGALGRAEYQSLTNALPFSKSLIFGNDLGPKQEQEGSNRNSQ